jgi:hypothetical protein
MNIFEQLNILLTESEGVSKTKESDIPIHPEMETKEQGEMAAAEKILKLFQKLKASVGSGGSDKIIDEKPEIPDEVVDPMMKEAPKSSKDKSFEKNKLAGWDEKSDEKIKKEVDVDNDGNDEDDFDDFDYKKNQFGDEEDDDETPDYDDDDRSEDEKLKDSIDDAIDSLNNEQNSDDSGDDGDGGDDSGANWGDDGEDGEDGQQNGEKDGDSQQGEQQNGDGGDGGDGGQDAAGSGNSSKDGGKRETMSQKQKRLEDLKKSLDSDNMKDFNDKMREIKDATDEPEDEEIPGGQIEKPSDEDFKEDMKKAGFDDKTIDEMTKKKNTDGNEDYNEKEMDELKKQVVDGLEDSCKKKGGSALASTIVKNSLKRKINDEEWKEMLKLFLKGKAVGSGNMSTSNKGIKWGHKNHLWRDAVLPTDGPSKGTIQTIHCFVDFSGSVEQDLVYTFLGKVIDMCVELKYTKVKVYGFGERLVEPKIIDKRTLKDGADVALSQTWDFISSQHPGPGTENFSDVAKEINKIKQKEKKAVFLIFGDAYWEDYYVGPKCLKYEVMNEKYLDDICVLAYYTRSGDARFAGIINLLRELVGIKHIITTKASSIHD